MIVDKKQQQQQHMNQLQQQERRHRQMAVAAAATGDTEEEEEEDGENDEENIVIDMVDEDDDEDDDDPDDNLNEEEYRERIHLSDHDREFDSINQFGAISVYNNSNGSNNNSVHISNNNNNAHDDQGFAATKYDKTLQQQDSSQATTTAESSSVEPEEFHFNVGDLIWFDPNQLGYSIPGKVIDYYAGLTVLTVEGYAQPDPEMAMNNNSANNYELNGSSSAPAASTGTGINYEAYNKLLLEADYELQVYDLSDLQQFKTIKLRLPLSDECGKSDLVDLDELSQESIIWNLKLRYKQDLVYTRCGHKLLLSLNPYKQLSNVYNLDQVNRYDTINSDKLASLAAKRGSFGQQQQPAGGGSSSSSRRRRRQVNQSALNNNDKMRAGEQLLSSQCNVLSSSLIRWLLLHDGSPANRGQHEPSCEEPHLFGMANEALGRLLTSGQDQCFVLLGESGSGKTEASKLLVQYLATVNKSPTNLMTEQILESMQVLESFGNAKTVHNDNSSRFGKSLEIRFNLNNGFIMDAKTSDLNLLDRTRIVSQAENERNYHIFYELLAGLSGNEKEKYGLQSAEKYFYLNQGHCVELNGKEDGEDFRSLLASLQVLGFNYEEQDTIFRLLASVLHLGNIYFHRKVLAVRSGKLAQQLASAGVEGVEIGSDTEVRWVSHLLQIQFDSVMRCLTVRTTEAPVASPMVAGNLHHHQKHQPTMIDRIVTPLNIDQALDTRDAIARALYTCLFRWLIQRINAMIDVQQQEQGNSESCNGSESHESKLHSYLNKEPVYLCRTSESLCEFQPDRLGALDHHSRQSSLTRSQFGATSKGSNSILSSGLGSGRRMDLETDGSSLVEASTATMTILDAFGFENLAENNFEQLCINYAAELLQYHTNRYLLRLEQAEYAKERLRWEPINVQQPPPTNGANSIYQQLKHGSSTGSAAAGSSAAAPGSGPGAIVNLISKKPLGILALLDDECNFPKATDQSFVEKCHHNHTLNENYQRARLASNNQEFGVRHFRQQKRTVWYQVEGFIEKNRDSLRPDIVDLLVGSKMSIVADMLRKLHRSQELGAGAKTLSRTYDGRYVSMKPRTTTVTARFQDALHGNKVLESINCSTGATIQPPQSLPAESSQYSTIGAQVCSISAQTTRPNPWFVVCLKPNQSKSAQVFDVGFVQDQMRAMGLLELAQIRKIGYPIRVRYGEFVRRYKCLVPQDYLNGLASCQDIQAANRRLNAVEGKPNYHHSGSKHLAKRHAANGHEIKRAIRDVCSAIIEYRFSKQQVASIRRQYQCGLTKMFLNERLYQEMEQMRLLEHQRAIETLQKATRGWLARREFQLQRRAAIVIQAQVRGWLARREYWRQYVLIVVLQRHWRRQLVVRRRRAIEARRRLKRQQQQLQLQELQAQQRKHADQFRHRLQPNQLAANRRNQGPGGANRPVGLDIPEELAQLYRLQQNFLPVHDLTNVNELDLEELWARERQRRRRHRSNRMSVPFLVATETEDEDEAGGSQLQLADLISPELAHELEADEQYGLQSLMLRYYTLNVPQFGYSRLPITRPFSWPRLTRKRAQQLRQARGNPQELDQIQDRHEAVEQKAMAIYKLILRYIDSDLNESNTATNHRRHDHHQHHHQLDPPIQKVNKFKLIADYIIYLCLNEPLLRDEIFLQLMSQSWQNQKAKSAENVWKLMVNCLCCFRPQDPELTKFLLHHASDYCCEKYRPQVLRSLSWALKWHDRGQKVKSRKYPPTMLEYWAHQNAVGRLALSASCYMDDHALNGPIADHDDHDRDLSPEELSVTNHSNKTVVQIGSQTNAEALARAVLKARQVPEPNLIGWSVEVQHEGAQSEFSCRLRGDDLILDHFSRLELLPEFANLIDDEFQFNWVPPVELSIPTSRPRPTTNPKRLSTMSVAAESDGGGSRSTYATTGVSAGSRRRKQASASEFCAPQANNIVHTPMGSHHRQSLMSHRSTDSSFISSRRQSSEVDLASAARLSQNSRLNRRYMRDSAGSEYSAPTNHFYQPDAAASYAPLSHQGDLYHAGGSHYQYPAQQHYQESHVSRGSMMSPGGASRMGNRRSMSMQELQLASSALNGRYFGGQQPPTPQQHAHYASSYVTGNSPHLHRSSRSSNQPYQSQNVGSLQQLPMLQQPVAGHRRRSQTPNSMSAYGYGFHRPPPNGYSTEGDMGGERRSRLLDRGPAVSGSLSRDPGHLGGRSPFTHRSASTSSRTPRRGPQPSGPSSDYASACSDYERVGAARYATPNGQAGNLVGQSSSSQHRKLPPTGGGQSPLLKDMTAGDGHKKLPSRPQNPLIERYKLANQARSRRREPRKPEQDQENHLPPKLQNHQPPDQTYGQSHYMGSSAMSDSSEAPSLASHVRGIKVPTHNADLDQYLDDLFNPVLDEAELDDLSDARSMATSIRGCSKLADLDDACDDCDLSALSDANRLARMIRGTEQDAAEDEVNREAATLSPTFESLLESLQGGSQVSGQRRSANETELQQADGPTIHSMLPPEPQPTNTSEVFNQLGAMNLSELKALNEQLEHQIQAAQSNRPSLELSSSATSGEVVPPTPPPLPSFGAPDDVYSRAKTIRVGKVRWPPAQGLEQAPIDNFDASLKVPEVTTNKPGNNGADQDVKLMPPPPPPPPQPQPAGGQIVGPETGQPKSSLDLNPGGSVGKLKISSEMKAKLEQLTNGSGSGRESATPSVGNAAATGLISQVTKSLLSASGESNATARGRLDEQRKNLLEHQLLGAQQAGGSAGDSGDPQVVGSKVLAVKQQLAAAAGVALAALDSGNNSRASSRRQSTAPADLIDGSTAGTNLAEGRRSRVLQDELGPQTKAAISQRQAFYQMSASSDQLDHLAQRPKHHQASGKALEHGGSELRLSKQAEGEACIPPPPLPPPGQAMSSDDLVGSRQRNGPSSLGQPAQLTRSAQMSNLNEAGQDAESDRLYGQSIAKSIVQRQHESLMAAAKAKTATSGGDQWISTSPDPARARDQHQHQRQQAAGAGKRRCSHADSAPLEQVSKRRCSSSNQVQQQRLSSLRLSAAQVAMPMESPCGGKACFVYGNVDWQVKIRKEFFLPSETYNDPLVVQLVFAQLVADVFNPRHWTRLNNKERAAIKSLMKDNSIGYAPSLPQIGEMQQVKQELVRMARSFGLYFTRSYPAYNFALIADQLQQSSGAGLTPQQQRRRRRSTSSHPTSGSSSSASSTCGSDSCDPSAGKHSAESISQSTSGASVPRHSRQALRLMNRLRNANNLGSDWIDMVAVHHSGLRLVAVEQQPQQGRQRPQSAAGPALPPWSPSGGELATPTPMAPFGYRVLETLKYRDMTDVSQIGQQELLVSMRNGKKCWLISSDKASQLGTLLRYFHADYNDHITTGSITNRSTAIDQQQATGTSAAKNQKRHQQQRQASLGQNNKDALLASDDDHHGDHIEQRQIADRFGRLHPATNTNNGLADGDRILSNNLANNLETSNKQHKLKSPGKPHQQPAPATISDDDELEQLSPNGAPARSGPKPPGGQVVSRAATSGLCPIGPACSNQQASTAASNKSNSQKTAKKKLWQNSLSRMSNKFSLFGGSQSRATSTTTTTPTTASNGANAKTNKHKQQQHQQLATSASSSNLATQQVALDAWIETKVDFEEDDDESTENNNNVGTLDKSQVSSMQFEEHEQQPRQQLDQNDQQSLHPAQQQAEPGSLQASEQPSAAKSQEDGKYSLLQFALYNFREAIDKYSLESRANKAGPAQAGDTSTLRGSLKLIESLRRGSEQSKARDGSGQSQQGTKERKSATRGRLPQVAGGSVGGPNSSDWTWRELAEMVKFTKSPIKQSLLKLPSDELSKRAVDCFLAIMQYMGDLPTTGNSKHQPLPAIQGGEVECVYLILMNCHNYPILRDEIYCQLMKQTTNNRSQQPDSCLRGWRLFSIVAAYFDCSPPFKPYLLKYLETAAYDKRRAYCSVAALCLQNLRKTFKYNGRKNVPSIEEIAATSAGRNSKRQIYRLPGGTERVINTKSTTVVDDIIHEICTNMLNVTDPDEMLEFSLYCIADGDLYTMPLNRDEYILDITTELIKNHQQYFLIFCRSIWHYPLRLDSKLYIEVIFNQIAPDYLEGLLLVLPSVGSRDRDHRNHRSHRHHQQEAAARQPLRLRTKLVKEIARIAALLHRASGTDYMPHKDEVKYLLPKPIIAAMKYQQRGTSTSGSQQNSASSTTSSNGAAAGGGGGSTSGGPRSMGTNAIGDPNATGCHLETVITTPSKWVELVQNNWREMSAFDTLDAKAQFLDIIRHWPLFGSSFFAIKFIQRDLIQPMDYILALNKFGIQMLDMSTHETIHNYPFNEVISTRKVRSEDGALFLDLKCGNLMKRTIIRIQTDQAHEISRLIRQYIDIELLQQKQLLHQQSQQQQPQSLIVTTTGNTENGVGDEVDQQLNVDLHHPPPIETNGLSEQESS